MGKSQSLPRQFFSCKLYLTESSVHFKMALVLAALGPSVAWIVLILYVPSCSSNLFMDLYIFHFCFDHHHSVMYGSDRK